MTSAEYKMNKSCRCPLCYWALYDGDFCMNSSCKNHGRSVKDYLLITREEVKRVKRCG